MTEIAKIILPGKLNFTHIQEIDSNQKDHLLALLLAEKKHLYTISPQKLELFDTLSGNKKISSILSELLINNTISLEEYEQLCMEFFNNPSITEEHTKGLLYILQSKEITQDNKQWVIQSLAKMPFACQTDTIALANLFHERSNAKDSSIEFLQHATLPGSLLSDISSTSTGNIFGEMLNTLGGESMAALTSLYISFDHIKEFFDLYKKLGYSKKLKKETANLLSAMLYKGNYPEEIIDIVLAHNDNFTIEKSNNSYMINMIKDINEGGSTLIKTLDRLGELGISKEDCKKIKEMELYNFFTYQPKGYTREDIKSDNISNIIEQSYDNYKKHIATS